MGVGGGGKWEFQRHVLVPERQSKGQVGRSFRTEMSVSVVCCFALFDSRIVIRTDASDRISD